MESKVTFDLGSINDSIIKIITISSPDVRDKIARRFIEALGHTSSWCKIVNVVGTEYQILPIKPDELRREAMLMLEQADLLDKHQQQAAAPY